MRRGPLLVSGRVLGQEEIYHGDTEKRVSRKGAEEERKGRKELRVLSRTWAKIPVILSSSQSRFRQIIPLIL